MITLQLLQQIVVFFLMMSCGFTVVKCGLIDAKSSRTLSVICIYIIMPCVMINAFQIEYSRSIRNGFLLAVAAAILIHITSFNPLPEYPAFTIKAFPSSIPIPEIW